MAPSMALAKRHDQDMALMPPPPVKRTKRPSTALDEDDYTNALSDIIARDYFPGLAEAKAQEEYLSALESDNDVWIKQAGQKLRETMTPMPNRKTRRTSRDTRFDSSKSWNERTPVPDTPRGNSGVGSETPITIAGSELSEGTEQKTEIDTSGLSLTSFQSKYTSEDNESFNTLLDKQNNDRRKKYAYLWTEGQVIPSQRLLTHRAEQTKLIEAKSDHEAQAAKHNERALVPITTGATSSRSASLQSWTTKAGNTFMFQPDSVDEHGIPTVMEAKEAASKAGPKEIMFANTRFPPQTILDNNDHHQQPSASSIPPSPSLDTQIIERRDARRAAKPFSTAPTETSFAGDETPRVNGYAFVEEDEPENIADPTRDPPSYRDLLAGQTGDSTPNPFKISEIRRREDLHLRLVAKEQARKREKERETQAVRTGADGGSGGNMGNMTPAARKLMEKLGRTPVNAGREARMSSKEMWTPVATPRRKK